MNKKIKKQWIEALLSGEYKQTTDYLYCDDEYCCLGVLCDIAGDGYWREGLDGFTWEYVHTDGSSENTNLPNQLRQDLGLSPIEESELIYMNDAGVSFEEIAHHIKENL